MKKRKKPETIYLPMKDYGDPWINRLAAIVALFEKMENDEKSATLDFIVGKYVHRIEH